MAKTRFQGLFAINLKSKGLLVKKSRVKTKIKPKTEGLTCKTTDPE
jgi:hypothetical protein